jgi:DNA-binding transcriptional LysR family regulator
MRASLCTLGHLDQCNVWKYTLQQMKTYDLNLLRVLDALLATGSVTAAAERVHLSVPATSHTLARLREVMADPLLVRAGRRLVPTPRALELKEPVARLLAQAHALLEHPTARDLSGVQRAFVVRAPDGTSVAYGAVMATALQQTMPRSSLHFVPEAHGDTSALREGRIDIDVGTFRLRDPEVEVLELLQQDHVTAARADHAWVRGPRTPKRYVAQAHVAVMQRPRERSAVDASLAALGLQRAVTLTVPSAYAALVVAARSTLVATVPERIARVMSSGLGLKVLELPFKVEPEPLLMAWHPRLGADPAHRWLRELLQRVFGRLDWKPPSSTVPRSRKA